LIGLIKIPFSTVIYPFYKGHRKIALIAFVLELTAFLLLFFIGSISKPLAILLILLSVFGLPIGYYSILRKVAGKSFGDLVGTHHAASEEQAINEIIKKANKHSQADINSGA